MSENFAAEVWEALADTTTTPLDGEPVAVPLDALKDLVLIPWFVTDGAIQPAVFISHVLNTDWDKIEAHTIEAGGGLVIAHEQYGLREQALRDVDDIAALLEGLPDGTTLELLTNGEHEACKQRFAGEVRDAKLHIDRSWPALDAASLTRAMELCRQVGHTFSLESDQEVKLLQARVEHEFVHFGITLKVDGTEVSVMEDGEPSEDCASLVQPLVFRAIFPEGPWSFPPKDEETDNTLSALAALAKSFAPPPPPGATLLHSGKVGKYYSSNLLSQAHIVDEDVEILDGEMAALGFRSVGEFNCDQVYSTEMRGYVNQDGDWGLAAAHGEIMFWLDFYTTLEGGASITTTTNTLAQSKPSKKLFKHSYPALEPGELWQKHKSHLEKQKSKRREPESKDLAGLCAAIDECLEREGLY